MAANDRAALSSNRNVVAFCDGDLVFREAGMTELVRYNAARQALAEARRVDEIKHIHDVAAAAKLYAKQAKDRALIADATEIQMRARDAGGKLLMKMRNSGERRAQNEGTRLSSSLQLTNLGITKTESSRWQAFAALPEEEKEAKIARAANKAVASVEGTLKRDRAEMRKADEERIKALGTIDGKFKTLVVDPPWDYNWLSIAGRASPGYATMTREELLTLNVCQWAEENCHLYLWTTNNFMTRAVELMAAWGFQHKTVLTWVKPRWGLGSYFRNSTEHVLFGIRGELRTRSDSIATHFEAPLGGHSAKPDIFYEIVRAASYLPCGELFQRQDRDGFINVFAERAAA